VCVCVCVSPTLHRYTAAQARWHAH